MAAGRLGRPDFRVSLPLVGEVDVEVTQLRSKETAARATAIRKLDALLKQRFAKDAELSQMLSRKLISVHPLPSSLKDVKRTADVALNEMLAA